jgi:hypothetical protein
MNWTQHLVIVLVALLLTGCRYYYSKPGATEADFARDHTACIKEVGMASQDGTKAYVATGPYRGCMQLRGWIREEKADPGRDWYRGLEEDRVVAVDEPPPPSRPSPVSDEPQWSEETCRRLEISGVARDPRYRDRCAWRQSPR